MKTGKWVWNELKWRNTRASGGCSWTW